MRTWLQIQAHPNVSFACEGVIEGASDTDLPASIRVKLLNASLARLISGVMPCEVQIAGRKSIKGNVRKTEADNIFIVENK